MFRIVNLALASFGLGLAAFGYAGAAPKTRLAARALVRNHFFERCNVIQPPGELLLALLIVTRLECRPARLGKPVPARRP